MLAAIRDQLLLQKMYETDLQDFKQFKKSAKKGKGKKKIKKSNNSRTGRFMICLSFNFL